MHRWAVVAVFVLASALNYLDRQILTALAPTLMTEFRLTPAQFGVVISAFSLVYAFSAPLMGLLIDALGLRWGAAAVVAMWSLAGMSTGLVGSFGGLLACRAALGLAEAGGIPASGKTMAVYLAAKERALGSALSQVGITIGSMAAPLVAVALAASGWRTPFVVCGAAGLLWLPLWLAVTRGSGVPGAQRDRPVAAPSPVRDPRFWALVAANILAMTVYSLWMNWTTYFLVNRYGLHQDHANQSYAWIPPLFATLGGLCGGWLAMRSIPRLRISFWGALVALICAAVPLAPGPALATGAISAAIFGVVSLSVNYYTIPLDIFGPERAAFSVSALTGAFGLMQTFFAPLVGDWSVRFGWMVVCASVAGLPLLSVVLLRRWLPGYERA